MPFQVGPLELVVVLAIALIVLGPKKLPEVGRSLGKGMREFKDSISGMTDHDDDVDEQTGLPAPAPTPTATASTSSSATSPDKQTT